MAKGRKTAGNSSLLNKILIKLPVKVVILDFFNGIPKYLKGHKQKEVRHDNTAPWTENVQGSVKYLILNASSKMKVDLRAGNEEEGEMADAVGCSLLRVEHVKLHLELNGEKHVVEFDFLGKDCARYYNSVC